MEHTEKMSFKEWMENLWYHYKWPLILGGLVVVFLLISLAQCASVKEIDVNMLHVGPMYISPDASEQIKSTVAGFATDCTGDGEINVALLDITVNKFGNESAGVDPVNYDQNGKGMQRFQTEIRAGKAVIYALDEEFFNICVQEGILTPFSEILDESDMPANIIDGCGVKISELDAYQLEGLSRMPEGAILCIRRSPAKDVLDYGRDVATWECNRDAFVNILKYKAEKNEAE